jgi:hypothetical protein
MAQEVENPEINYVPSRDIHKEVIKTSAYESMI